MNKFLQFIDINLVVIKTCGSTAYIYGDESRKTRTWIYFWHIIIIVVLHSYCQYIKMDKTMEQITINVKKIWQTMKNTHKTKNWLYWRHKRLKIHVGRF